MLHFRIRLPDLPSSRMWYELHAALTYMKQVCSALLSAIARGTRSERKIVPDLISQFPSAPSRKHAVEKTRQPELRDFPGTASRESPSRPIKNALSSG